jgi:hypothetical protein
VRVAVLMSDPPDLDDDERATLVAVLREVIERDRYFMSPRMKRLRGILDKFDPAPPRPEPAPGEEEASAALPGETEDAPMSEPPSL